ncbi:hypothetical protein CGZ80_26725 [Rhodopirellula sp. MGV]|nr:hypothetical protein CGZ80_26725 [Rhodopirellula sp. MGV]PNY38719.1 hypothetical protein C2E31_02060 [Rhodopirellula baltica]
MWLAATRSEIYALVKQQPFRSIANLDDPINHIVKLSRNDRWVPVPVIVDGQPIHDIERLLASGENKLLGIRRDKPPVLIDQDAATTLEIPECTDHLLSKLAGTNQSPFIRSDGTLFLLHTPNGPKSHGRVEVMRSDGNSRHVWSNDSSFYELDQPKGIGGDHLDRVYTRYRDGRVFEILPNDELQEVKLSRRLTATWVAESTATSDLRQQDQFARLLAPFVFERVWTAKTGAELKATWLANNVSQVRLKASNGRIVNVPIESLNANDQRFLTDLRWHRRAPTIGPGKLEIVARHRTRQGSFTNWDQKSEAEKAAVLPRIFRLSAGRDHHGTGRCLFATTRGLETWDGMTLKRLTAAPADLQGQEGISIPEITQLLSLPNGDAITMFTCDPRAFYWDGSNWGVTNLPDDVSVRDMTMIGDVPCATYFQKGEAGNSHFGIATFDRTHGWKKHTLIPLAQFKTHLISLKSLLPIDSSRFVIAWLEQRDRNPEVTRFTFHDLKRLVPITPEAFSTAAVIPHDFGGPAVFANGLMMFRTHRMPFRLLRWCDGAPFESAVIDGTYSMEPFTAARDFAVQPDGVSWSIEQGKITRMDASGSSTIDIHDPLANAIDVDSDGIAYARSDHLTVIRYVKHDAP